MIKSLLSKLSPMPILNWIGRLISTDPTTSSSRLLQTIIVLNLVIILWLVVAHSAWVISDNVRLVAISLIVSGAGSYMFGKTAEGK
jgi:uncharacterized membrane-anchored protein